LLLSFSLKNFVYHAVFLGFSTRHPVITVRCFLHPFVSLSGMLRNNVVKFLFQFKHLPQVNLHIRSNTLCSTAWLVNHYSGVLQGRSFTLFTSNKKCCTHTCGPTGTDGS